MILELLDYVSGYVRLKLLCIRDEYIIDSSTHLRSHIQSLRCLIDDRPCSALAKPQFMHQKMKFVKSIRR